MKLKTLFRILRSLPLTVYFNFHYLPFLQAIRLPILLYRPHLIKMKGKITIQGGGVKTGLVHLGFPNANIYPNSGITWENHGGTVIFKGKSFIGNDSYLSFGHNTKVEFGNNFVNQAGMKLVSAKGIKFGNDVTLGWACMVIDTNFHPLYDIKNDVLKSASGEITIGNDNWFGTECVVMHSVKTPPHCTFGLRTIVTRGTKMLSYCLIAGTPAKVVTKDVMRHPEHRTIEY